MKAVPFPKQFDGNEWFVIISIIASYFVLFLIRKKFPTSMMVLLILFAASIARIADHVLAPPKLDLYDLMDRPSFELFDLLSYFLYGPFACLYLYGYKKLKICGGLRHLLYISFWSLFAVAYEWVTLQIGVFTFKEWKSFYSLPVYIIVQSLTILFYKLLQHASSTRNWNMG